MPVKRSKKSRKKSKKSSKKDVYTVYIKNGCFYSISAIDLLKSRKKKYVSIDFQELNDSDKQNVLNLTKSKNNNEEYKLYPKIFKNKTFIGGYDILKKLLK